ncbi:MAG TPA: hypothetical protein VMV77_12300 [Bacteroidales bacterium]|nr:hypothetical protein [Bacteroidales bacterium]
MIKDKTRDFLDTSAKIISVIFHPLFMPVYGMVIIFSAPTLFGYLPFTVKKLLFLIILINNVLLPFSLLPYFKYRNIISSWSVENRRERIIPLLITTLLYAASSFIIFRFPIPVFLKSFIFASFFLSLIISVVNFWWKISIHSVGAGALTALVLILSVKMYSPLMWYLIIVLIISGLLLSSRLKLNSHNPLQVWIGYLTGFLGLSLYMWFF